LFKEGKRKKKNKKRKKNRLDKAKYEEKEEA